METKDKAIISLFGVGLIIIVALFMSAIFSPSALLMPSLADTTVPISESSTTPYAGFAIVLIVVVVMLVATRRDE